MDALCHCGEPLRLINIDKVWKSYVALIRRGMDGRLYVETNWDILDDGDTMETLEEIIECDNGHQVTEFTIKEI